MNFLNINLLLLLTTIFSYTFSMELKYRSINEIESKKMNHLFPTDSMLMNLASNNIQANNDTEYFKKLNELEKFLESGNINLEERDSEGSTPLIRAALLNDRRIIRLLLKAFASANASNHYKKTDILSC